VADQLMEEGYSADALHGDLSQAQRDQVMDKFRRRNLRMLVATDVAARGLDVTDLTHVIHYNLPDDPGSYTHRSGRTGRAGKSGVSVSIINLREKHKIAAIENRLRTKFECCRIPGGTQICEKKLLNLIDSMKQADVSDDQLDPLMSLVADKLAVFDRQELVKRFVCIIFDRLLAYYRNAPDLNVPEKSKGKKTEPKKVRPAARGTAFTRFILNVGKKNGIHPGLLIGEINEAVGASRIQIGKIEIMNYSTLLEADSRFADQVRDVFHGRVVNGKPVAVKLAGHENKSNIPQKPLKGGRPFKTVRIKARKKI
jgi:ATP-dependent RNA helicase DeaD